MTLELQVADPSDVQKKKIKIKKIGCTDLLKHSFNLTVAPV